MEKRLLRWLILWGKEVERGREASYWKINLASLRLVRLRLVRLRLVRLRLVRLRLCLMHPRTW